VDFHYCPPAPYCLSSQRLISLKKYLPWHSGAVSDDEKSYSRRRILTFLEKLLPRTCRRCLHRPNTNIASDKDRIANDAASLNWTFKELRKKKFSDARLRERRG